MQSKHRRDAPERRQKQPGRDLGAVRTQMRAGLWIAGVPIAALALIAVVQIVAGVVD